ncbi:phosphotriesterase family protein [Propionibacteriaceae bacterium Y1685]
MTDAPASDQLVTALGPVTPAELGRTNCHEHLFQRSPLLPEDILDDPVRSTAELADLGGSGFESMVDATPLGLGRRPTDVAAASAHTGVHVIATTGRHRDAHYTDQPWVLALDEERLAEIMINDVRRGLAVDDTQHGERPVDQVELAVGPSGLPVRASVLKVGLDYWEITAAERATVAAIGRVHAATGAAVLVHTEFATAAHEVLDLLAADGVAESRVVIAHADRNPDLGLHAELAARGAFLGHDGAGRAKDQPDQVLIDLAAALVDRGHGDRILLGADVARARRYRSYGGLPGLAHLGQRFLPRLRERIGADAVETILVANPAHWLVDHGTQRRETSA